jgi:hypothetical protein
MMKKLVLVILIAGAAWWYFIGGRKLSEEKVVAFYRTQEAATLDRKPDVLCSLLADDFTTTGTVAIGGTQRTATQNKTEVCDAYQELYATFEKLGDQMGGMLQLDSRYEIHSIEISADGKTATVDISTSLDVAGSIMNMRAHTTDTLIRKNGSVLLVSSDGTGSVGGG